MNQQLHYHWFWGLIERKNQPGNLSGYVDRLFLDQNYRNDLFAQKQFMENKYVILRFIYRLFNINNYAFHTHVIRVYEKEFEKKGKSNMDSNNNNQLLLEESKDSYHQFTPFLSSAVNIKNYVSGAVSWGMSFFSTCYPKDSEGLNAPLPTQPPESSSKVRVLKVTALMSPYLQVLDIHANIDDVIEWKDVKKAYHKLALQTHPDKVAGHEKEFQQIQDAFKKLEDPDSIELDDSYYASAMDQLRRIFDMMAEVKVLRARVDAILARQNEQNGIQAIENGCNVP